MNNITSAKQNLITELKTLVAEERKLTTRILHLLQKVERERIYVDAGYSSLFDFTVRELGYSNDAAYRRITAMRLLKHLPEAEEKLESGALSLTAAAELQKFFKAESTSTLSAQSNIALKTKAQKLQLMESLEGKSTREVSRVLFQAASEPVKKTLLAPNEKQVSENLTQITITVDETTRTKIQKLMALLSNKNKSGNYAGLIEILVDEALDKHDPEAIKQRRDAKNQTKQSLINPVVTKPSAKPSELKYYPNPRYIPAAIKQKVFIRDGGHCQHSNCNSKHYLHYDHITPVAQGGQSTLKNLQLLCAAHNLRKGSDSN